MVEAKARRDFGSVKAPKSRTVTGIIGAAEPKEVTSVWYKYMTLLYPLRARYLIVIAIQYVPLREDIRRKIHLRTFPKILTNTWLEHVLPGNTKTYLLHARARSLNLLSAGKWTRPFTDQRPGSSLGLRRCRSSYTCKPSYVRG